MTGTRSSPRRRFVEVTTVTSLAIAVGLVMSHLAPNGTAKDFMDPVRTLFIHSEGQRYLTLAYSDAGLPGRVFLAGRCCWTNDDVIREWNKLLRDADLDLKVVGLASDVSLAIWGHREAFDRIHSESVEVVDGLPLWLVEEVRALKLHQKPLDSDRLPHFNARVFVAINTAIAVVYWLMTAVGGVVVWRWVRRGIPRLRSDNIVHFPLLRTLLTLTVGVGVGLGFLAFLAAVAHTLAQDTLLLAGPTLPLVVTTTLALRMSLFRAGIREGAAVLGLLPDRRRIWSVVPTTLGLIAVLFFVDGTVTSFVGSPTGGSLWRDGLIEPVLSGSVTVLLVVILDACGLAPFLEELIFAGLFFGGLRRYLPVVAAAMVSGIAFAAAHLYPFPGYIALSITGAASAVVYEKSGSLLPCIFAHAVMNFSALAWSATHRLL